jgi:hypothetical protein
MRRRDFLSMVALTPALLRHRLGATQPPLLRAAVVIGVDRTGGLPVLNAARSSAVDVGTWLRLQSFNVRFFVTHPVSVAPIFNAIAAFVRQGNLDQLVIYFSGHGFTRDGSEMWLLSDAPANPNEAISVLECVNLARESAIPSVILISDACRSAAATLNAQRVRGSLIFPNEPVSSVIRPEVDRFFAALPGDPAFELSVDDSSKNYEGLYTSSFLDAFKRPSATMVKSVNGVDVVPNRSLKNYLADEVSRRAQARSLRLQQMPDAILECSDSTYIGQVARREKPLSVPPTPSPPPPMPPPSATVSDLTATDLRQAGIQFGPVHERRFAADAMAKLEFEIGYAAAKQTISATRPPLSFETETGLSVHGMPIRRALTSQGMFAEVLDDGRSGGRALIRLAPRDASATSVMLEFADGGATVVAALQGYIGAVTVQRGLVKNVSYTPSRSNHRWSQGDLDQVEELRAIVAVASRLGTFRIEGSEPARVRQATQLADRIRVFKGVDPSLGLYAAYAYAEAGLLEQIRSVGSILRTDLNADLFDVALLSGRLSLSDPQVLARSAVPFCPMLSQGWSWLRVKNVNLPDTLSGARDFLRPALWSTFDPGAVPLLRARLEILDR